MGWLGKNHFWLFHAKDGWAFDVWTTQNRHGLQGKVVVLLPNFDVGTLALYFATYHPGLFKTAGRPPAPLHAPFVVEMAGKGWRTLCNDIDQEMLAMFGIEHATGLSRQAA